MRRLLYAAAVIAIAAAKVYTSTLLIGGLDADLQKERAKEVMSEKSNAQN